MSSMSFISLTHYITSLLAVGVDSSVARGDEVPCPGRYCVSPTKFRIIRSLGIPGISERSFQRRKDALKVDTWSTSGERKTTFTENQIAFIDKGKFSIVPDEASKKLIPEGIEPGPQKVEEGDFVLFPKGFSCKWIVEEPVSKHSFNYK